VDFSHEYSGAAAGGGRGKLGGIANSVVEVAAENGKQDAVAESEKHAVNAENICNAIR